ncbi:MAG TPA: Na+/H+ antiporter subunit E [Acidimicrobiales bacterium]|nr:Na+/H+ antiporter subunit E [Acidimicrobiales bacterium]
MWAGGAWTVLSWTASLEHILYGAVVSAVAALAVSPLGPAARPWLLADVRRLARLVALAGLCLLRIVRANVVLARRVWSPSLPLRSGMLVFPTEMKSDGAVTAVALVSSVIVDNQLVDVEPGRVQYHAIWVGSTDEDDAYEAINGPLERLLRPLDPGPTGE